MKEFWFAVGSIIGLVLVAPLIGVLAGAFSGWVVGLFFGPTILRVLSAFAPETASLDLWQIGAALGFVGGFFKSSTTVKKG